MDVLGKLFGDHARVKILRLFLLNPKEVFEPRDICARSQLSSKVMHQEINRLASIKFIKQKVTTKIVRDKKGKLKRKKSRGWILNDRFPYLNALKNLIINSDAFGKLSLITRFKNIGRVKLFVVSGIFIEDEEGRVDILIVGDALKRSIILRALKGLGAETGKELRYALFDTKEFLYRCDVHDRFVRDVFDYPHEKLIDRIGVK